MKSLYLTLIFFAFCLCNLQAQSRYKTLGTDHYIHFYGDSRGMKVPVKKGIPWFVFSDRADNPVYSASTGSSIDRRVDLGKPFLVINRSGRRLEVIEADKVITTESDSTYIFRSGFAAANVIRGWMEESNLVLSQRCMKVVDVGIPSAPKGLFNLQGLFVSSVVPGTGSYNYYSFTPGIAPGRETGTPIGLGGFGFIYKIERIDGRNWFLLGRKPEIPYMSQEIILMGWKPNDQIELWKHRLALEYDWENASARSNSGDRLTVLQGQHNSSISRTDYRTRPFVEKEYNYQQNAGSTNYYFQRALGGGFRNVIIEERENNLKVGVIRNSSNVDNKIIHPAIDIANDIMEKLLQPKVIFMLDGTESLEDQAENIYSTITSTCLQIAQENQGKAIQYNYGAAVYRDVGYGAYIFEKLENLASADVAVNWFRDNLRVRIPERKLNKNINDTDYPEAVYYGINETFKHFNAKGSFFNPTFYVLIGDCGNKASSNPPGFNESNIRDSLKLNVSDMVVIQFEHRTNGNWNDQGRSWDIFPAQFRRILNVYGDSVLRQIPGGKQMTYINRPGSFLAFTDRSSAFSPDVLSNLIKESLLKYNYTLQEKLVHLVIMLQDPQYPGSLAKRELRELTRNFIQGIGLNDNQMQQVMEWVVFYLANAASSINVTSGERVVISDTRFDFFNPGYVCLNYNFLDHAPYKHIVYLTNTDIERISNFYRSIMMMRGQSTRNDIQKAWHFLLMTSMGLFSDINEVNNLTISEATSILTGFRGNTKYDNIKIGQILLPTIFPNSLMLEYIFECGITYGYLQSIRRGTWELRTQNLRAQDATINSLLRLKGKPNINQSQYDLLSSMLVKKDVRSVNDYFRGYPSRDMDPTYKLRAYWVEADFFSHGTNDFVNILNNIVR